MDPDIIGGIDLLELSFNLIRNLKFVNESMHALFGDAFIFTGESFKCFVGFFVTFAAQNGLNSFGNDSPIVIEVLVKCFCVE